MSSFGLQSRLQAMRACHGDNLGDRGWCWPLNAYGQNARSLGALIWSCFRRLQQFIQDGGRPKRSILRLGRSRRSQAPVEQNGDASSQIPLLSLVRGASKIV